MLFHMMTNTTTDLVFVNCSRCRGSGHYSFTPRYGTTCFKCRGEKGHYEDRAKYEKRMERNRKARERRAAKAAAQIAERQADVAAKRAEFVAANEGILEVLEGDHRILRDLAAKLDRYGSLSEKQVALAHKIVADMAAKAERDANREPLAEGRRELSGIIISFKSQESQWGYTSKMLVELDDGNRVYGSVPKGVSCGDHLCGHDGDDFDNGDKGKRVTFKATVECSDRDENFGFFKRPTAATVA